MSWRISWQKESSGKRPDSGAVRDGERRVEHALRARQHVVHGHEGVERLRLVDAPFERAVVTQRLQAGGAAGCERLRGVLDELARIRLRYGQAEKLADYFSTRFLLVEVFLGDSSFFGERVQVCHEVM